MGRKEEAVDIFNFIARFNGKSEQSYIPYSARFAESYADLSKNAILKRKEESKPDE